MSFVIPFAGSGTSDDPRRIPVNTREWTDNGDGTATVTLTDEMLMRVRGFAASAADALNGGSSWADLKAIKPEGIALTLVEQDLTDTVKKKWSEFGTDPVPQGFVVSHDNGTTKGLWKAQSATTAEPTKNSADWSLVIEVTV